MESLETRGKSSQEIGFFKKLEHEVGVKNLVTSESPKFQDYLKDMADYPSEPLIIVQPESIEQVSAVVRMAREAGLPNGTERCWH